VKPSTRLAIHCIQCVALVLPTFAACRSATPPERLDPSLRVEWPVYGGDPGSQHYSPLETITPANIARLRPVWRWSTGERMRRSAGGEELLPDRFEATPVMLADTLYLSTPFNRAVALDAGSGRMLWQFDPDATRLGPIGGDHAGFVHRGVAVWSGPQERRVFLNSRWQLFALDARTGRPIPSFGEGGMVDLTRGLRWQVNRKEYGNTSPPVIWRHLVIVGSSISDELVYDRDPPGDVQAFDVLTGARVWRWDPIPRSGEPGSESWEHGANERVGHANVWSPFSVDTSRGLLYLPVSTPSNDWYGGRRSGAGLFGESLVCLDARTGKVVWYYQLVHHGLWDYDPAAPPMLVSLNIEGRAVEAVAQAGKTGFLYVFDRVTGKPLWPIEERPVPPSDVPGEMAAATQPFPTRPPPFARQGIADSDLVDFTPALRERARAFLRQRRLGPLFTPPSLQGTIVLPGWIGGAGWGGGAFDPASQTLYIKASNKPTLARLVPPDSMGPSAAAGFIRDKDVARDDYLFLSLLSERGLLRRPAGAAVPVIRPPYGTLTAIDLEHAAFRWQVTIGDMPEVRSHPLLRALKLPPLGIAGAPGPLLTRSGLLFLTGGGRVLYGLDARTGAPLWSWELGGVGYANPMTYRTAAGRQFVVIATGREERASLMAFALPD
jgi:quinoprotein glucose dehydrogenase